MPALFWQEQGSTNILVGGSHTVSYYKIIEGQGNSQSKIKKCQSMDVFNKRAFVKKTNEIILLLWVPCKQRISVSSRSWLQI